jgi:penicillin-binding protein 2
VAIGQESSQFTPIQLANYIATLVNGGTRNATHLLKEVKSSDYSAILETYQPRLLSTVEIEDANLNAVKAGMLMLTTEGSVRKYFTDLPFRVGAKTGSAQVSANTESNAVFVCFAPYENPEVAMAIVVEHGGSGGELAAIASDVLSYYFSARETQDAIPEENTLIR